MPSPPKPTRAPLDPYRDELLYYRFRRAVYRADHAIKRLTKFVSSGNPFSLNLSLSQEGGGSVEYRLPDEKTLNEFLYAVAPLVRPESEIYWEPVIGALETPDGDVRNAVAEAREAIQRADDGGVPFIYNSAAVSARRDLLTILNEVLFADDTAADAFMARFYQDPLVSRIRLFRLHAYATDLFRALSRLAGRLEALEALPRGPRLSSCIYCKTSTGSFTSVEHVVPESLGNEGILLPRGWVCDECNSIFSQLEERVLGYTPLNQLRFLAPVLTKKGRFPTLKTPQFTMTKKRHNQIVWRSYAGKAGAPDPERQEDGTYKFSISWTDARLDGPDVARLIVKIGLGCVAIDHGVQAPQKPIFDHARHFALEGGEYASRLWMVGNIKPHAGIHVRLQSFAPEGWVVVADLLGVHFLVGLTDRPLPRIPAEYPLACFGWDLWSRERGPHHVVGPNVEGKGDVGAK